VTYTEEQLLALKKPEKDLMAPWDLGYNSGLDSALMIVRRYLNAPSCERCGNAVIDGRCVECSKK